jgi:hypothetical protein
MPAESHDDRDIVVAGRFKICYGPLKYGRLTYVKKALGKLVGQRTQTKGQAGGDDNCFHEFT